MISLTTVRKVTDQSAKDYEKCWEFLSSWKKGKLKVTADQLLDYQPTLARAIFRLGDVYHSLAKERKSVISRKDRLSPKWFRQRLNTIKKHQTMISETIHIGRILGDYFAWMFYQGEREYLRKHFEHQETLRVPTGLGGKGELAFISKIGIWNGQFTIYHGITTFLRIGDVSFYDPTTNRITGIGELKTERDTGTSVGMTLYLLWPRASGKVWPRRLKPSKPEKKSSLPPKMEERLKRQLKSMASSLNRPKFAKRISIGHGYHLEEFMRLAEQLRKKNAAVEKLGDGLLLYGFTHGRERSLWGRLLPKSKTNFNKLLRGVEIPARGIIDMSQVGTPSNTNSMFIGHLDLSAYPGTTPMFWWPVPSVFVRQILFHEVTVVAVYNPAHLVRKFRASGFDVQLDRLQMKVSKKVDEYQLEMVNMRHFLHYIQQHLMREDFVLTLFNNILKKVESGEILPNTRIDLDTQLIY